MKPSRPSKIKSPNPLPKQTSAQQSKLKKLINENPDFDFIENGKIKCSLTAHEIAPTLENFEVYLKSKSYKKGTESKFDIEELEEFLVPYKDNQHFLFCRLTAVKLPKKKTAIEKHVNSKKFKHRMAIVIAEANKGKGEEGELLEEVEEESQEESGEEEEEEEESIEEQVVEVKTKNGKNGKAAPKAADPKAVTPKGGAPRVSAPKAVAAPAPKGAKGAKNGKPAKTTKISKPAKPTSPAKPTKASKGKGKGKGKK